MQLANSNLPVSINNNTSRAIFYSLNNNNNLKKHGGSVQSYSGGGAYNILERDSKNIYQLSDTIEEEATDYALNSGMNSINRPNLRSSCNKSQFSYRQFKATENSHLLVTEGGNNACHALIEAEGPLRSTCTFPGLARQSD